MFQHVREAQEREIARENQQLISSLKYNDTYALAYHVSSLLTAVLAFGLIFLAIGLYGPANISNFPTIIFILAAFALVLAHEHSKRKVQYIRKVIQIYSKVKYFYVEHWYRDYLSRFFWLGLIVLLTGLTIPLVIFFIGEDGWTQHEKYQTSPLNSSVNMVITTASGLLAAQIALFSFMLQQVLSRYSGVVAQKVASHRVFKLLAFFPISGLLIPFVIYNFGAPQSLESVILPLTGFLLLIGLLLTVLVAKSGLNECLAIQYFGVAYSKDISKAMPGPIKVKSVAARVCWRFLRHVGLDFRNKDRLQAIKAPPMGSSLAMESLGAALGVANKAVVEGQHDVFVSSLLSIEAIITSYAEKREQYISSEDDVFTYLNHQFAALIESTSKHSNEYLVSNLTGTIGRIAKLTYCIGKVPEEADDEYVHRRGTNYITSMWIDLLVQSFEHTHILTRSTAAHVSLNQISELVKTCIVNKDLETITITYLPAMKKIFALCLLKLTDAYHKDLAAQCIKNLMSTLTSLTFYRNSTLACNADPNRPVLENITEFSALFLAVNNSPSFNLNDPINVVVNKLEENRLCIQEIFFMVIDRDISDLHAYRIAISDIKSIVDELKKMAMFAVNSNAFAAGDYLDAIFEILYLVARGLPEKFKEFDQQERERNHLAAIDPFTTIEHELIQYICEKVNELSEPFYKSKRVNADWQQSYYSVVGFLVTRFVETNEKFLRSQISEIVNSQFLLVKSDIESGKVARHYSEEYLQLATAWLSHFHINDELADQITTFLAQHNGYRKGHYGSRGRYGYYGYPTLSHHDFYLFPLRNIRHPQMMTKEHWEIFKQASNTILNDEVLIPFAVGLHNL